ncbi:unnamed protein product [Penicillium salamii]|uniref:Uncharacterized protein n=1 Tax=Penicillium salamii TaxID=1612424 RepID=A0A9W4I9X9_9EURO|nr:unnamed protein product [Penicillium salamii]CAG7988470.1 unnamed protein product [Penicillium salamii]CAG8000765.1 unnamed protein product [Penicillium salamii]CAG8249031.1 unnamed protein product [Penicillium salamii]CAG8261786.1 unnamed protein product [Penicillium salamii]
MSCSLLGSSSDRRRYIPSQLGQIKSDARAATLFLSGKMYEITLDETFDATFTEYASSTGKNLERALRWLEDM